MLLQDIFLEEHEAEEDDGDYESELWESVSSTSLGHDQAAKTIEKDLIMVIFIFSFIFFLLVEIDQFMTGYCFQIRFICFALLALQKEN